MAAETRHAAVSPGKGMAIVLVSKHHGNTRKVAEAIAAEHAARLFSPAEARQQDLSSYALAGFGSGIYYGRHDRELLKFVEECPALPPQAFVFSTAGSPLFHRWYHRALRGRLARRSIAIVGDFTCPGWDSFGPLAWFGGLFRQRPNAADLQRATDFARQLAERKLP